VPTSFLAISMIAAAVPLSAMCFTFLSISYL
jgi:hypothetical protein